MKKESIICIIILIFIFIGDVITENYTKNSTEQITNDLQELESMLEDTSTEKTKIQEKASEIGKKWNEKHNVLAYFIEHEELEKVKTGLVSIKSYSESDEIAEAKNEVDKTIFLLEHIVDKSKVNLRNVF